MSRYVDEPDVVLIPIEDLGASGMSDACERRLLDRAEGAVRVRHLFDAAFSRVWRVASELSRKAPDIYPPPRLANVVLLTRAERSHPYFRPFVGMSLVLYAADFEPETSSTEHAAYQLILAERLGQTRRMGLAALEALPYLAQLDEDGVLDFARGAARSQRPDAEAARLVAEALPKLSGHLRIDGLAEDPKPPQGYGRIKGTPIVVAVEQAPVIQTLVKRLDAISSEVVSGYFEREALRSSSSPSTADRVLAYLAEEAPELVLVDAAGEIVWDPRDAAALDRVRDAFARAGDRPLESLLADLRAVDATTKLFFRSVAGAEGFSIPNQNLEEGGGVFIHQTRGLLAYALAQPGLEPLREEAPPYHRQLLVARAMHEWGHIAVDAGLVPVPPSRDADFKAAGDRLASTFAEIVAGLPSQARAAADSELAAMKAEGTRLEDLPFSRLEDYRSNLLCRRLLPPGPLDAYVRANVRSLESEPVAALRKLARYAYEVQYLFLLGLRDPIRYLFEGTYFREEYTLPGLVSEAMAKRLIAAVGALCACYELDEARIAPP
jgi:hypothetical protein